MLVIAPYQQQHQQHTIIQLLDCRHVSREVVLWNYGSDYVAGLKTRL